MTCAVLDDPGSIVILVGAAALLAWWTFRIREAISRGTLTVSHEDRPDEEIDRSRQPDRFGLHLAVEIVLLVFITALLLGWALKSQSKE